MFQDPQWMPGSTDNTDHRYVLFFSYMHLFIICKVGTVRDEQLIIKQKTITVYWNESYRMWSLALKISYCTALTPLVLM